MPLAIRAIPCLSDNYIWLLRDEATGAVAVCDPGEAGPAAAALREGGGRLDLILLTHHHGDHVGGVEELKRAFGGQVVGNEADARRLPPLDVAVRPGGTVEFGDSRAEVIDTPGHTRGHIAFNFKGGDVLLCGDTLFSLGCGRLLEGTAAEMFRSLQALNALPGETLVCCGHEYTESNARFALSVDGGNAALRAMAEAAAALRRDGKPTVPTTLAREREANPFLRAPDAARLAELRSAKDSFR
ncbi:hydroxyacylglutathione hydrolase [Craurococcus roseus]|uniref:Hydroxyacylglutathione hydrolase n=1 Tax=Craurococcus roseus TaxID=77585 RepID=A0ABP3R070_9PROT